MFEPTASQRTASVVQLIRTGLHSILHSFLDGCSFAVAASSRGLVRVAFVGVVVPLGAVRQGARIFVRLGLHLRGDVVVKRQGCVGCQDHCAGSDCCRDGDVDAPSLLQAGGVQQVRVRVQDFRENGQRRSQIVNQTGVSIEHDSRCGFFFCLSQGNSKPSKPEHANHGVSVVR